MHIGRMFEKVDIESTEVDIGSAEVDIEKKLRAFSVNISDKKRYNFATNNNNLIYNLCCITKYGIIFRVFGQ